MGSLLKYEVPTATQNIGDNYIEDFEMMETGELQSYADGKDYQSLDFIDADKGSIKYEQLGEVDNLIALEDDNFYGADAYDGANGRRSPARSSRSSRTGGRTSSRRRAGFFGGIGDAIRRSSDARRQRRLARVEGRQSRKQTDADAKLETARSLGKGSEADIQIAKSLGSQPQEELKKGLSKGAIIGITIGALVVIGVVAYFVIKKKKAGALVTPAI